MHASFDPLNSISIVDEGRRECGCAFVKWIKVGWISRGGDRAWHHSYLCQASTHAGRRKERIEKNVIVEPPPNHHIIQGYVSRKVESMEAFTVHPSLAVG